VIVPPCAGGAPAKAIPKMIERKERYYTRFLNAVSRSEELKHSQFLLDFLTETDSKNFSRIMKEVDKVKQPRGIEEYVTALGQVNCAS